MQAKALTECRLRAILWITPRKRGSRHFTPDLSAIQREDEARNAQLDVCDREFYTFNEITEKLLRFVVVEQARIDVPRTENYPRIPTKTPRTPKDSLFTSLTVRALAEKGQWRPGLDEARTAAREVATGKEVAATEADI
jgi:hypothetical protein